MRSRSVEAQAVKVGDYVFNSGATRPEFQWSRVRSVRTKPHEWTLEGGGTSKGEAIEIDAGFIQVFHPREGVAVRQEA